MKKTKDVSEPKEPCLLCENNSGYQIINKLNRWVAVPCECRKTTDQRVLTPNVYKDDLE